jgi:hypothetical protein
LAQLGQRPSPRRWRRSSGQQSSSGRCPPTAVIGAWPEEAAGTWCRGEGGRRQPARGVEERKVGRQPTHGGGNGRRGVEGELGAAAVFDASPSRGRRQCVARGGGRCVVQRKGRQGGRRRVVQRRGRRGGSQPVEEAAADAGWRRSSGQRPSSARRPPAAVVGAWPGEAADAWCKGEGGGEATGAWCSAEERKAGRQPAHEEADNVLIRVDEMEYVYIY